MVDKKEKKTERKQKKKQKTKQYVSYKKLDYDLTKHA